MTTAVVIPTYNERDNIAELTEMILRLPHALRVIVVDDNSPDGTGELADTLAAADERLCVIHRAGKLGLGTAYLAGFQTAFQLNVSHIMTMDADFSHHPRYIPDLLRMGRCFDLVIGSRYVPGGGTRHWRWQRVMLSWG
ncbi:MAG: glycosyltransferase, partial [Ardenticatenaceae bacterium]